VKAHGTMKIRTFVNFEADFPDEAEWDEQGNPVVPDGRSVARVIARSLNTVGFRASEPAQHTFYGWAFDVALPKRTAWCLLQAPGPWLLLVEERRSGLRRFTAGRSPVDLERLLKALDHVLKADERFSSVQWFTRDEYESGCREGTDCPFAPGGK